MIPHLLHPGGDSFPEGLVALGEGEVPLKLRTNGNEVSGFLVTPLRHPLLLHLQIASIHVDVHVLRSKGTTTSDCSCTPRSGSMRAGGGGKEWMDFRGLGFGIGLVQCDSFEAC